MSIVATLYEWPGCVLHRRNATFRLDNNYFNDLLGYISTVGSAKQMVFIRK